MFYREFQPVELLSRHIKCFWILEQTETNSSSRKEILLPDSFIELIFHYGDRFREYLDEKTYHLQPRSFIYGQKKNFIRIEPDGKIGIIGVRFLPGGISSFINTPASEVSDSAVNLNFLLGKTGSVLEDQILNAYAKEEKLRILQTFLLKKLFNPDNYDFLIEDFIRKLNYTSGNFSIEKFSGEVDISARQIRRRFLHSVGIGPKSFSRIVRFQNAFQLLKFEKVHTLTSLVYHSNYYDQSHFIRDFKEFTGSSPTIFLTKNHNFINFMLRNNKLSDSCSLF
jgi:AraC-like DNA-binding protein